MFFHCSCKNSNTSEYNNSTMVDSIIIDSNTIKEDNFELDIQLKRMHENKLFYNTSTLYEVIQPTANCQMGCFYCGQNHEKKNKPSYKKIS